MAPIMLFLVLLSTSLYTVLNGEGFTVNLINRDNPVSPYYNQSATQYERVVRAAKRSLERVKYLSTGSSAYDFSTILTHEYHMTFFIGTPSILLTGLLDTGSDLSWVNCDDSQVRDDIFNSGKSKTYKTLPCDEDEDCRMNRYCYGFNCDESFQVTCGYFKDCEYSAKCQGGAVIEGEIGVDTFTFFSTNRRVIKFPKVRFGCAYVDGTPNRKQIPGLVGLGGGSYSLISQISPLLGAKQFSYCLTLPTSHSKISFGRIADIDGKVVSTPMIRKGTRTNYYLTLTSLSVGDRALSLSGKYDIVIDSGTTLTYLPSDDYDRLKEELNKVNGDAPVVYGVGNFDLCYKDGANYTIPTITFGFRGANVVLKDYNTFIDIQIQLGLVRCLSIVPLEHDGHVPVFGAYAQINFVVKYDLGNMRVSFKHENCIDY